jgi:hypothetical protein
MTASHRIISERLLRCYAVKTGAAAAHSKGATHKNHAVAESGAHAQFMVFFGGISLCLTNSLWLVTFGKYEGGIHGCAGCPAGADHGR